MKQLLAIMPKNYATHYQNLDQKPEAESITTFRRLLKTHLINTFILLDLMFLYVCFCYLYFVQSYSLLYPLCHICTGVCLVELLNFLTTLPISPECHVILSRVLDLFHLCCVCVSLAPVFKFIVLEVILLYIRHCF